MSHKRSWKIGKPESCTRGNSNSHCRYLDWVILKLSVTPGTFIENSENQCLPSYDSLPHKREPLRHVGQIMNKFFDPIS